MYPSDGDSAAMLKVAKYAMAALVTVACLTVSACGSGKEKETVVVRVGDNAITAAMVDHWIEIESVTAHGGTMVQAQPQPPGALPVPPEYTACVAYLVRHPQAGKPKPTSEQARVKCAFQYKVYKETVLSILIRYYWDVEEGAAKGVNVSDAEITQHLERLYPHPGELERYLKNTHESLDDDRMLVRGKLMTEKLVAFSARTARSPQERLRAIAKHVKDEADAWTPRTSCSRGYIVPQCKQFREPQYPSGALRAPAPS